MSWQIKKKETKLKFTFKKMFDKKVKIESLSAIKGKKAEEVTAEEISAINAELAEAGFNAIEVSVAGTIANLKESHEAAIEEKDSTIAAKDAEITKSNNTIADLQSKLGAAPAAEKEEVQVNKDVIKDKKEEVDADRALTDSILSEHGLK